MKKSFQTTIFACFTGYIVQAIINNFAPLLFLTFVSDYQLSLGQITLITTLNFAVQLLVDFLSRDGARMYVDGENAVGDWLPGTDEIRRGTNFWAWRVGEDVGRRSVNTDHPFWRRLSGRSVHWHYHGVLDHPAAATPLVALADPQSEHSAADPWGLEYRAIPGHRNTLMYYDEQTFPAELVVSTMDASYHHGSGFMPGASQLLYRMLRWLGE